MSKIEQKTDLSFEAAMERLEQIVSEMESSKLPLAELLLRYEEGTKLIAVCNEHLGAAENRIEILYSGKALRSCGSLAPLWCCQAYPACFSSFSCFVGATELPKVFC